MALSGKLVPSPVLRAALVAGEASGDLLAGLLLDALLKRWHGLQSFGIGGPSMVQRGFSAWWEHDKLSVHGFGLDVLMRYTEIVGIRRALRARLLQDKPEVFIGVDAPDFNLSLEEDLRHAGIRTVHFVCPSVWAWRAHRLAKIRRSADHVLCLFPFEPALLGDNGINATFVGHPLAQLIPDQTDRLAAREHLGLATDRPVVAILPGSRLSEIRHLTDRFLQAAVLIRQEMPEVQYVLPVAPGLDAEITARLAHAGLSPYIQVLQGQSHAALQACDVTLIASGTATLEAALFRRPMVIAYRMSALSWALVNRQRLQPWVGLPNILCQAFVVPELLQEQATPARLAQEVLSWLESSARGDARVSELERTFARLHAQLRCDTGTLAAQAVGQVLNT